MQSEGDFTDTPIPASCEERKQADPLYLEDFFNLTGSDNVVNSLSDFDLPSSFPLPFSPPVVVEPVAPPSSTVSPAAPTIKEASPTSSPSKLSGDCKQKTVSQETLRNLMKTFLQFAFTKDETGAVCGWLIEAYYCSYFANEHRGQMKCFVEVLNKQFQTSKDAKQKKNKSRPT